MDDDLSALAGRAGVYRTQQRDKYGNPYHSTQWVEPPMPAMPGDYWSLGRPATEMGGQMWGSGPNARPPSPDVLPRGFVDILSGMGIPAERIAGANQAMGGPALETIAALLRAAGVR